MFGDSGKLIVAKGFEKLPKVKKIARSGHTAREYAIHTSGLTLFIKNWLKWIKVSFGFINLNSFWVSSRLVKTLFIISVDKPHAVTPHILVFSFFSHDKYSINTINEKV